MWNGLYKIYYILKLNLAKQNKTDRFAEIQVKFPWLKNALLVNLPQILRKKNYIKVIKELK